jgi:hypothetical protein
MAPPWRIIVKCKVTGPANLCHHLLLVVRASLGEENEHFYHNGLELHSAAKLLCLNCDLVQVWGWLWFTETTRDCLIQYHLIRPWWHIMAQFNSPGTLSSNCVACYKFLSLQYTQLQQFTLPLILNLALSLWGILSQPHIGCHSQHFMTGISSLKLIILFIARQVGL